MSDAMIGYGTRAYMQALANSTALTKLAEVTSVSLPNEQVAEVEVTHYESPGRSREFIAGLTDPGEITVEMNFAPGSPTDQMLVTAKSDGKVRTFRVVTPEDDAQMYTFPIIVRGYERAVPLDDRMTANVTLRIAGAVVQDDAAADPTDI